VIRIHQKSILRIDEGLDECEIFLLIGGVQVYNYYTVEKVLNK
jgi:hypothetical protein